VLIQRAMLLLSCTALCASGFAISGPVTPPRAAEVWLGQICTGTTQGADRVLLAADKSFQNAPATKICVDRSLPRLDYQANWLRIESNHKNELYGVRLKCASEELGHRFLQRNEGKDFALVAGDKVIGSFRVATSYYMGCGWYQAFGEEQAKEQCKAIVAAWGVETSECTKPCDTKSSSKKLGVCIVHG
jgi:hypothetical protein